MRVFNRHPGVLVGLTLCLAGLLSGCDDDSSGEADGSVVTDGGRLDGGTLDATLTDAMLDASSADADISDAMRIDAMPGDATVADAQLTDGSAPDAAPPGRARSLTNMRLRWTQGAAGRGQPTTTMTGDGVRLTGGKIGP